MDTPVLTPLGISPSEERVYRQLLRQPSADVAALAASIPTSGRQVRALLASLEQKGLLTRAPGRRSVYHPMPPDAAVEFMLLTRQEELERARVASLPLLEEFRKGARSDRASEVVELLVGPEVIGHRFRQLQRMARKEVLSFDKPPYVSPPGPNVTETEMLSRGVRYRAIYDRESLEIPWQLEAIRTATSAGEEARVLPHVPMKLYIADHLLALLPLNRDDPGRTALLVHTSALLDALVVLFDALWQRSTPIHADPTDGPTLTTDEHDLLTLIVAGLKDDAIARDLGIARRSVQRRLRSLMSTLGVADRHQLILEAARRASRGQAEGVEIARQPDVPE